MKDLVSSIAVGVMDGKIAVDVNKEEEDYEEGATDMPVAMLPRTGQVTLLQLDGNISKEEFPTLLEYAKKATQKIYEVQKKALKEKYGAK